MSPNHSEDRAAPALTALESRDCPTRFAFDFTPAFVAAFGAPGVAAVELGGRSVARLIASDDVYRVTVDARPLGPDRIAEDDFGGIAFDTLDRWSFSLSGLTLAGGADMAGTAAHECMHDRGVGTRSDWAAHLPAGVGVAPDGVHLAAGTASCVAVSGGTRLASEIDRAVLESLGYDVVPPEPTPALYLVSAAGPDGLCRLYLAGAAGAVYLGSTGRVLVQVGDYDLDGAPDLRVQTPGAGPAAVYFAGGTAESGFAFGGPYVVSPPGA